MTNERYSRLEVALLTPRGRGAVACVGVRGRGAWELFRAQWSRKDGERDRDFDEWTPERAARPYFGLFRFDELGGVCDEIVLRRRTANSFEIDGHGGDAASSRTILFFLSHGAVEVTADEWDRAVRLEESCLDESAFERKLNSRAETLFYSAADALVCQATTDRIAKIAVCQREAWRDFFAELTKKLDEPTPDLSACSALLEKAARRYAWGRKLVEPIVVALIGAPNAGKSSILNAVLGYDRAVVSSTAGTTRDLVSASLVLNGWNFRIVDAAGLRETADAIERAGARLATESALRADLALVVYDSSKSRDEQDAAFARFFSDVLRQISAKSVRALNKIDLSEAERDRSWNEADSTIVRVSAKTLAGLETLTEALTAEALGEFADVESGLAVWTPDQTKYLNELRELCDKGTVSEVKSALLARE